MTGTARAIPRSILYTSALSLERVVKAWSYDADVHLIDLEDSVPPQEKVAARAVCRAALNKAPTPANIAVRVNELGTIEAVLDLVMLAECQVVPGFIVMTKVESAVEVRLIRATLASAGAHPEIFVTVETPSAVAEIDAGLGAHIRHHHEIAAGGRRERIAPGGAAGGRAALDVFVGTRQRRIRPSAFGEDRRPAALALRIPQLVCFESGWSHAAPLLQPFHMTNVDVAPNALCFARTEALDVSVIGQAPTHAVNPSEAESFID